MRIQDPDFGIPLTSGAYMNVPKYSNALQGRDTLSELIIKEVNIQGDFHRFISSLQFKYSLIMKIVNDYKNVFPEV